MDLNDAMFQQLREKMPSLDDVFEVYRERFDYTPNPTDELVDLTVVASTNRKAKNGPMTLSDGFILSGACGKSSGAITGPGVTLLKGEIHSCQIYKGWASRVFEGAIFEIPDVPLPLAEMLQAEQSEIKTGGFIITWKPARSIRLAALDVAAKETTGERVDMTVVAAKRIEVIKRPVVLPGGFILSSAQERDSGAQTGPGVILMDGDIDSGGTLRHWKSRVLKDATFKIPNVPMAYAKALKEDQEELFALDYIITWEDAVYTEPTIPPRRFRLPPPQWPKYCATRPASRSPASRTRG